MMTLKKENIYLKSFSMHASKFCVLSSFLCPLPNKKEKKISPRSWFFIYFQDIGSKIFTSILKLIFVLFLRILFYEVSQFSQVDHVARGVNSVGPQANRMANRVNSVGPQADAW